MKHSHVVDVISLVAELLRRRVPQSECPIVLSGGLGDEIRTSPASVNILLRTFFVLARMYTQSPTFAWGTRFPLSDLCSSCSRTFFFAS
jgi:hypothetical protein